MPDSNLRDAAGCSFAIRPLRWAEEQRIALVTCASCVDLYWVRLGNAEISTGNEVRQLGPGDLLTLEGNPALAQVERGLQGYQIHAGRAFLRQFRSDAWFAPLDSFLASLESRLLHIRFGAEGRAEVDWLLSRMLRAHQRGVAELSRTSLRLLFGHFLLLCHQEWGAGQQDARGVSSSGGDVIRSLRMYIDEHLSESFGLVELAQKAGYTPSYLSSLFTKATGQRLNEYICSNRIARAQDLLRSTQLKVMQVCYDVGFRDLAHFNRTFKKMVGVTPSAYRHLHGTHGADGARV